MFAGSAQGTYGLYQTPNIYAELQALMTQLLQEVIEKASARPSDEHDVFARIMLAGLEAEQRWSDLLARPESEYLLERLADEALVTHREGRTHPLHPEDSVGCGRSLTPASGMRIDGYRCTSAVKRAGGIPRSRLNRAH
jgi:hypothetical protein